MAATSNRVLVKMRPHAALAGFGLGVEPAWFLADLAVEGPTPWDAAHAQVADQLGVDASDVVFAEPDLAQSYPDVNERGKGDRPFAIGSNCDPNPQQSSGNRPIGPEFAWHLRDDFSQLGSARDAVPFSDPR